MSFSETLINFFSGMSGLTAYLSVFFILFACGFGVPIPEDITIISAGILVALGKMSFTGAVIICMLGVLLGDSVIFFLGRKYGNKVFEFPIIKKVATPERILKAEKWVRDNSRFICFIARFLPGLRTVVYLTAGTMGIRPVVFWTQDGFAALISVPLWVYCGYFFGNNIDGLLSMVAEVHNYLIVGVILLILLYFGWKKRSKKALS